MFRSPLQPMWDLTIHPSWGPTSSLAHRPISGSDTICNRQIPPLAYIVLFGFPLLDFPSKFPHPYYKECFVPLSNRCGISQSTPLGDQRPRWHTVQYLALIPFVIDQSHRQHILSSLGFPFWISPQSF